jgi:glucose-6-phosphate 1-dehydrogenase
VLDVFVFPVRKLGLPGHEEGEPVRDEKLKVLKALLRIPPEQMGELTMRGQDTAGVTCLRLRRAIAAKRR